LIVGSCNVQNDFSDLAAIHPRTCKVFFDRIDGSLVLRAIVIEVALRATWEIPYIDARQAIIGLWGCQERLRTCQTCNILLLDAGN